MAAHIRNPFGSWAVIGLSLGFALAIVVVAGCGSGAATTDGGGAPSRGGAGGEGGGSGAGGVGDLGMDGGGDADAGAGAPALQFGQDFEAAFCAGQVACNVYADAADCRAGTLFDQSSWILTAAAALHRGTVTFDPTAAAACIAALPTNCLVTMYTGSALGGTNASFNFFDIIPACQGVITGLQGMGDPCAGDLECAPGTPSCGGALVSCFQASGCCSGTCQAVAGWTARHTPHAIGENCSDNNLCQLGSVCGGTGPTCVVLPGPGGTCGPDSFYGCGDLREYCTADAIGTTGTCVRRLPPGASCASASVGGDPCQLDSPCSGSPNPSCTSFTDTLGTPCNGLCAYGLECPTNVCVPVEIGSACAPP